jgi:hypothetical protein
VKQTLADIANWCAKNGAFVLTFIAMTGAMVLAFFHDDDVTTLFPTILGLYLGSKTGTTMSAHFAVSRNADAAGAVKDIEETAIKSGPSSGI